MLWAKSICKVTKFILHFFTRELFAIVNYRVGTLGRRAPYGPCIKLVFVIVRPCANLFTSYQWIFSEGDDMKISPCYVLVEPDSLTISLIANGRVEESICKVGNSCLTNTWSRYCRRLSMSTFFVPLTIKGMIKNNALAWLREWFLRFAGSFFYALIPLLHRRE